MAEDVDAAHNTLLHGVRLVVLSGAMVLHDKYFMLEITHDGPFMRVYCHVERCT